jgi:hypothetical protein
MQRVRYHGSLTDLHGEVVLLGLCACAVCRVMWETYLTDPEGHSYSPDLRWRLISVERGVVVQHVRPQSVTCLDPRQPWSEPQPVAPTDSPTRRNEPETAFAGSGLPPPNRVERTR